MPTTRVQKIAKFLGVRPYRPGETFALCDSDGQVERKINAITEAVLRNFSFGSPATTSNLALYP
jgi:hypothetical protein